jgi:hypothetical protein
MRNICTLVLAGLMALPLPAQQGKGTYEPPDREPTPEETQILEYLNRFRADPVAEADLIAPPSRTGGGVDWKMFHEEMKQLKPMPPMVMNLDLLDAARKHSYYMVLNGLGHDETPGKAGFYGASPADRIKQSGFKGGGWAENAFAGSGGPYDSHAGFIVDAGAGPGGMQPGRGHRKNMMSAFREIGPGGVSNGRGLSVTHDFGSRDVRMAGGVVYIDANGNNFYDIGEGVGQVTISSSDGGSITTWKSGGYTLDLKGQRDVVLTAYMGGREVHQGLPRRQDNVKFDWNVPKEIPLKEADKLLEAADKAKDTPKEFAAIIALTLGARNLYLDAERKKPRPGADQGDRRAARPRPEGRPRRPQGPGQHGPEEGPRGGAQAVQGRTDAGLVVPGRRDDRQAQARRRKFPEDRRTQAHRQGEEQLRLRARSGRRAAQDAPLQGRALRSDFEGEIAMRFALILALALPSFQDENSLPIRIAPQDSPASYQAQLLGDLDRPVGTGLTLGGVVIPAKVNDKGGLELDVKNDGKFRTLSGKREIVSVQVQGEGDKPKSLTIKLEFHKREDGAWVYRNLTTLRVQIGAEQFVIVDANGNGSYADAKADGMVWEGRTWLFPLPGEHERWCSATHGVRRADAGPRRRESRGQGQAARDDQSRSARDPQGGERGAGRDRPHAAPRGREAVRGPPEALQVHGGEQYPDPSRGGWEARLLEGGPRGRHAVDPRPRPGARARRRRHGRNLLPSSGRDPPERDGVRGGDRGGVYGDRRPVERWARRRAQYWPVLCPVPGQTGVGTNYGKEAPDACPGDSAAGYPITVYFGTPNLKLTEWSLKRCAEGAAQLPPGAKAPPGAPVDCYVYDPQTGASADMTKYQRCGRADRQGPAQGERRLRGQHDGRRERQAVVEDLALLDVAVEGFEGPPPEVVHPRGIQISETRGGSIPIIL